MQTGLQTWLKDSITLRTNQGIGDDGEPTYSGVGTTISCKVEEVSTTLSDDKGDVVVSKTRIIMDSSVSITTLDEITLADSTKPKIIKVKTLYDASNTAWAKVIFT